MVAFYNAKDQAIYDRGDKFMSQTEFLQDDYVPTEGISYEGDGSPVSYANSMGGIMTQAPIPGPLKYIPEGDGGGDDDDDDDPKDPRGPSVSPFEAAKKAGLFFLNPLGYLASKAFGAYRKHQQRKKADNITEQASGLTDRENITKIQDYTGKKLSNYRMSRPASERNFTGGGPQANDPIGGFENNSGMGRTGYFFGGRVKYKAGGRTGYKDGYSVQDDIGDYAANVGKEAAPGGGFVGDGGNGDSGTKPVFYDKNDNIITTDFISKNPNLTINYTDPRNYASLKSKIGFNNILDNDDITAEGNLKGGFDKYGYDVPFTEQGIKGVDLTAGNFTAKLDPNLNLANLSYTNKYKGLDFGVNTNFDNTMLTIGTKFGQAKKNGGRIGFKNGGLASIL